MVLRGGVTMVFRVTDKSVRGAYSRIYSTGYCAMQYLMQPFNRVAYTAGVYGWNYDVFEPFHDGVAICTGYRNMPGERLENVEKYEKEACKIWNNLSIPYKDKVTQISALLKQLLTDNGVY